MSRFLIAAAHKSSGKTVVSTGLAAALTEHGKTVQTFKKGPDYIDPMWLGAASGRPCYNLDFNVMSADEVSGFYQSRAGGDVRLIETNKGLFDGVALDGSDSNAALAKCLRTPVILVVDSGGMTRGIAPLLLGYQGFDPEVRVAGVILNKVGGPRHEGKLRAAVEAYTDIPVLGAVWKNPALEIGERHLGLTTPAEAGGMSERIASFSRIITQSVDLTRLLSIADAAPPLLGKRDIPRPTVTPDLRIGIARDTAFGFYYPDDIEAFAAEGVELVAFDTLKDRQLPKGLDGLFIGGGFPETQMQALAANIPMRTAIRAAIAHGLPTYAECGGLMYLCQSLVWDGQEAPMVGVIPATAKMCARPQGRGYAAFSKTAQHLWDGVPTGTIRAHEFHYARLDGLPPDTGFARRMSRGAGIDGRHDGILCKNLIAGFCHLRTTDAYSWVRAFTDFVRAEKMRAK